jgi:SAM-dependent methyltransferase
LYSTISDDDGSRSFEEVRRHYLIERELADKLRNANLEDRKLLYTSVYEELFRRVPNHPLLVQKADQKVKDETLFALSLLKRFLRKDIDFLEIGAGDCALASRVAAKVKSVVAIDVANSIAAGRALPANCKLVISDGCNVPVPNGSISLAFSDQLMEHLHPDDALTQLKNIHAALSPNGIYICLTPNRLSGPHDISRNFDKTATGLHLREYSSTDLIELFKTAGFTRMSLLIGARGYYIQCPVELVKIVEKSLAWSNERLKRNVARFGLFKIFLGIRLVGRK